MLRKKVATQLEIAFDGIARWKTVSNEGRV